MSEYFGHPVLLWLLLAVSLLEKGGHGCVTSLWLSMLASEDVCECCYTTTIVHSVPSGPVNHKFQ
jgi:hypothetical protein